MDEETARRLIGPEGAAALAAAAEADPASLAAASRLRARFDADLAAAALTQIALRRRAVAKFGADAARMFLTADGLQQATRPQVAAHRAARLAAAGIAEVADLGCGIGADALALARAGLRVTAVERDRASAILAEANLAGTDARVLTGDAVELASTILGPGVAAFCDPARRTDRGRVWRADQFSPGWAFVTELLDGTRPAVAKLGPALPHTMIPAGVEAEWISDHGDVVEVALWAGGDARPGMLVATLLPSGERLTGDGSRRTPPVRPVGRYLYEPDGAAIRATVLDQVAERLDAGPVAEGIAYLTGDRAVDDPWATAFRVVDVLPLDEKTIRRWIRDHQIGTIEIKKRGIALDPASLRRRLKPSGSATTTMIISPSPVGAIAIMADRRPVSGST